MFYHPLFFSFSDRKGKHNTEKKNHDMSLHAELHERERNIHRKFSQFFHGAHQHRRITDRQDRQRRRDGIFASFFVKHVSLFDAATVCRALPLSTRNAHQRKFLMPSDYQKQIFSRAFYSSMMV